MTKFSKQLTIVLSLSILAIVFACTAETRAKEKPRYINKEGQGPAGAMVSIDGKAVNEEELMGDEKLEFAELQKKIYDLRLERVNQLLLEKVYGGDAKKAGLSLDDYIESKVIKSDPKISDKEYDKFVKEKHIPKEQLAQLKDRIMMYLKVQKRQEERQRLIVKVAKEHKVELFFQKPNIKVNVEIGNAPVFGSKEARVKIVEFSDFQCPFCSQAANTVMELKKIYGKKIFFAYKNFPLPMHPQAMPAAEAAMCINEQNTEKYWKYHDKLFANQSKLDSDSLKKFAKEVGGKVDQFSQCIDSHKYAQVVRDDMEYGSKLGVKSTPTFFINGRLVSGALPVESFKELIEEELSSGT